jgi:hypothetical protein
LYFKQLTLAEGAELLIYNAEKAIYQVIDHNLANRYPVFENDLMEGESLILELSEPINSKAKSYIEISEITYAFAKPDERTICCGGFGQSKPCHINLNCTTGNNWQCEANAVGQIFIGYKLNGLKAKAYCSGTLLNNTLQDFKPYFLTATHCKIVEVENWGFRFNYVSPACSPTTEPANSVYYYGATIKDFSSIDGNTINHTDYMLLELNFSPDLCDGVVYAGWDRGSYLNSNATVSIHHPNGDVKKISVVSYSEESNWANYGNPVYHKVYWQSGITEGGSSGGPLFNADKRVIGQLRGGNSDCGNTSPDFFGALKYSWSLVGVNNTMLKNYLDPNNSNLTKTNTLGMCVPFNIILNNTAPINTFTNICSSQEYSLKADLVPWATDYQWVLSQGAQVTMLAQGRTCNFIANGSGSFAIYLYVKRGTCSVMKTMNFLAGSCAGSLVFSPNPADNYLDISSQIPSEQAEAFEIEIAQVLDGRRVLTQKVKHQQKSRIDISQIPDGQYILRLKSAKEVINHRFIIHK